MANEFETRSASIKATQVEKANNSNMNLSDIDKMVAELRAKTGAPDIKVEQPKTKTTGDDIESLLNDIESSRDSLLPKKDDNTINFDFTVADEVQIEEVVEAKPKKAPVKKKAPAKKTATKKKVTKKAPAKKTAAKKVATKKTVTKKEEPIKVIEVPKETVAKEVAPTVDIAKVEELTTRLESANKENERLMKQLNSQGISPVQTSTRKKVRLSDLESKKTKTIFYIIIIILFVMALGMGFLLLY